MSVNLNSPFQKGMVLLQRWGWRCQRCTHDWIPRETVLPRVCPKCKSPYWDRPRRSASGKQP